MAYFSFYIDLTSILSISFPNFNGLIELVTIYLESNSLTGDVPSAAADLPLINIYWVKTMTAPAVFELIIYGIAKYRILRYMTMYIYL